MAPNVGTGTNSHKILMLDTVFTIISRSGLNCLNCTVTETQQFKYSNDWGKKPAVPGTSLFTLEINLRVPYKAKRSNMAPNVGAQTNSYKNLMLDIVSTIISGFRNGTDLFKLDLNHIVPYKVKQNNMALNVGHNNQYLKMCGEEKACSSRNETGLFKLYL